MIPRNTVITPKQKIAFASAVTGLLVGNVPVVSLLYPNSVVAVTFSGTPVVGPSVVSPSPSPANTKTAPLSSPATSFAPDEEAEVIVEPASQEAAAIVGVENSGKGGGMLRWLAALFGIIGIAAAGALYVRRKEGNESGFTIIEEK